MMKKNILACSMLTAMGLLSISSAFADNILIVQEPSGPDFVNVGQAASDLASGFENGGNDVLIVDSVLPNDLSMYDQVWNFRPSESITTADQASFTTFLNDSGKLFLTGEQVTNGFGDLSNASIAAFVAAVGGGTLNIVATEDNQTLSSGGTILYDAVGGSTSPGTGTFLSTDINGNGGAILWEPGTLTDPHGQLAAIFDINFHLIDPNGARALLALFGVSFQAFDNETLTEQVEQVTADELGIQSTMIARNMNQRTRTALGNLLRTNLLSGSQATTSGLAAGDGSSSRGAWIAPSLSRYSSTNGNGYKGTIGSISFGFDSLVTDNTVVGASVVLEDSDSDFRTTTGGQGGSGATVILYAGRALDNNITIDGFVGLGKIDRDIDQAGSKGDFDSDKWMIGLNLSKAYSLGKNTVATATLGLLHAEEDIDSYTLDNSIVVSPDDVDLTQGRIEFEISSQIGNASPYFVMGLEHDFENSGADANGGDKNGAVLGGGFRYQQKDNLSWGMDLTVNFARDEETASTFSGDLRYTF